MVRRFTTVGDSVCVMLPGKGYGNTYSLRRAQRVPAPVRAALVAAQGLGPHEVLWEPATKTASFVSSWDRLAQW